MRKDLYFKNARSHIRRAINYEKFFEFNFNALDGGREAIQETWNLLREGIISNEFSYEDLSEFKKTSFIGVINELLKHESVRKKSEVHLGSYIKTKKIFRAAIINENETVTKDRFVPRADKMRTSNRFSPKGVEWLYLGVDKYERDVKQCCRAEIRAKEGDNVKFCEFNYIGDEDKVIDLTVADNKCWEEISRKIGGNPENVVPLFISEVYFKLLSEEIFIPVNTTDKEKEYAPFHCMARYFESLGYDGIIYKSTVSDVGKNIVMFNKRSFTPVKIV